MLNEKNIRQALDRRLSGLTASEERRNAILQAARQERREDKPVRSKKTLVIAIALHDIPDGSAMARPLREGGSGRKKAVLASVLSGVPTVLGAAVGILMGGVGTGALAFSLGLAGGAMLQVTCCQLIPESTDKQSGGSLMAGLLFGAAICLLLAGAH